MANAQTGASSTFNVHNYYDYGTQNIVQSGESVM